jgi:hypothetical protein
VGQQRPHLGQVAERLDMTSQAVAGKTATRDRSQRSNSGPASIATPSARSRGKASSRESGGLPGPPTGTWVGRALPPS